MRLRSTSGIGGGICRWEARSRATSEEGGPRGDRRGEDPFETLFMDGVGRVPPCPKLFGILTPEGLDSLPFETLLLRLTRLCPCRGGGGERVDHVQYLETHVEGIETFHRPSRR